MQARYDIDLTNPGADEVSVSATLTRAHQARTEAENERTEAAGARTDKVVVGAAVAGADRQHKRHRTNPVTTPRSGVSSWRKASEVTATVKRSIPDSWRTNTKVPRQPPPLARTPTSQGIQDGQAGW